MELETRLAHRSKNRAPSPIRELLKFMNLEGMISLGGGYPNPETFAFEKVEIAFKGGRRITIEDRDLSVASQYGPSDAHAPLRRELIRWHQGKDGIALDESQVVVLNGSQEGVFIMASLFLDEDDSVVVSEPTYPGALAAFRAFTNRFTPVPLDAEGMNTEALEESLLTIRSRGGRLPKFIYTIPNGHNPGGVALSVPRRRHMIEIARRYDLLILEDDPYQLIRLEEAPVPPTLQSLDAEGRVVRLDSFSKIFAPGLRIGYASGPPEIMRQFVLAKQGFNLHTSTFIQEILHRYLRTAGHAQFRDSIRANCALYRRNRDAMLEAARSFLPPDVRYNIPREGLFVWFVLPEACDARSMVDRYCEALKVLLVPGPSFSTKNGCRNCMRASFAMVSAGAITEGMRRFAEMIRRALKEGQPPTGSV